jgi:hypothetical protein
MIRIQIITIIINIIFIAYISRLIIKGKLREEYAIVWCVCTFVLILFSFWRSGLALMAKVFGVFDPPNLVFTAFIFIILIYLLHLSVVSSKSHHSINRLTQEIALLKEKMKKAEDEKTSEPRVKNQEPG